MTKKNTLKQDYLENSNNCPNCESNDISAIESVQVDGGVGTQSIECDDCGATWTDVYRLVDVSFDFDNIGNGE